MYVHVALYEHTRRWIFESHQYFSLAHRRHRLSLDHNRGGRHHHRRSGGDCSARAGHHDEDLFPSLALVRAADHNLFTARPPMTTKASPGPTPAGTVTAICGWHTGGQRSRAFATSSRMRSRAFAASMPAVSINATVLGLRLLPPRWAKGTAPFSSCCAHIANIHTSRACAT